MTISPEDFLTEIFEAIGVSRDTDRHGAPARTLLVLICRVLLVCLIVAPTPAHAQLAVIAGVVRNSSGAVLSGVAVEASDSAILEKSRRAETDGSGQYRTVDVYNALNSSAILAYNNAFVPGGTWLQPVAILTPRLIRFTAEFGF
jgi:hypothetical protein